jgi:multiple sugar transport system substrate-binding protein/raffinose/stachyose/melibiose transport system substrate-binding protein
MNDDQVSIHVSSQDQVSIHVSSQFSARLTRRRWLRQGATAAAPAAVLAGACGPQAPAPGTSLAIKPGTSIRLHVRTGTEVDTLEERIPILEREQNIKVVVEHFPGGEYYEKVKILLASDSIGDVLWGASATGQGNLWAYTGVIRFVDDLIKAEKFDLSPYYPAAIEGVKFEGKLYGLPYKLQPGPMGIYYNVDAFEKAGYRPPDLNTTFDQLTDLARKIHQPGVLWGFFGTGANPGYQWVVHYLRAWGTDVISDDGKKSQLATPKGLAALQWYHDLVFKHRVAPQLPPQNADFERGQVAMFQSGSWSKSVPLRVRDAFRVMNTLMPKGPSGRRGSMGVTDFMAITKASKHVAEAWALTKHLTDKETGIRLGEGGATGASGTSGGRKDVFHSERLLKNPLHKVWIEAAENALPLKVPWNFEGEEHQRVLNEGMNAILSGEQALNQSTLAELDRRLQVVLDRPRPGR